MDTPDNDTRSTFSLVALVTPLVALGLAVAIAFGSGLWARSGWWGLSVLFAVVWGLELSALALGSRQAPGRALRFATLGAVLGTGAFLIAGFGLLGARLSAESALSFASADSFVMHWALHEKLAALHHLTAAVGAALLVPFLLSECTLWWVIRRRERDVARGDIEAAHETTEPRLLELAGTLLLFAAGAAVVAGSYAAPVPYAERPEKARLAQIDRSAARHNWDAACDQLRTAVENNGAKVVEHDLPGAHKLAGLCIQGRISRLQKAGVGCGALVASDEPLAALVGGGRKVVASCERGRSPDKTL